MNRPLKFLLIGLFLLLVLVVGAAAWLLNDDALVERQVERFASQALERQLSMEDLELSWGAVTQIRLRNLKLANPAWASQPDFLSIETISAEVKVFKLLRGKLDVPSLEIAGAVLALEEGTDGRENWKFGDEEGGGEASDPEDSVSWGHFKLSAFKLTHQSPERETPLDFEVASLTANQSDAGRVDLKGQGTVGGYDLGVDGFIDPPRAFVFGGPVSGQVEIDLGEIAFSATGSASNALTGEGANFQGEFKGPDFGWLLKQAALPEFSTGAFDAKADVKVAADGGLTLTIDGDLGSLKASVQGNLDRMKKPSIMSAEFDVSGPNLSTLAETFGIELLPSKAFKTSGDLEYKGKTVTLRKFDATIGQDAISISGSIGEWPKLNGTTLDVTASGADMSEWGPLMRFDYWQPQAFSVQGKVLEDADELKIQQSLISIGDSRLKASGTLGEMPQLKGAQLQIDIAVPALDALFLVDNPERLPRLPVALKGSLSHEDRGLGFKDMKLDYGGDTLDFNGLLAINVSDENDQSSTWQSILSGTYLKGQLESRSVGQLAQSLDIGTLPDERLAAGVDLRLEQGELTFSVAGANLGEMELDVKGNLERLPNAGLGKASFNVKLPSLKAVEAFFPVEHLPDQPASFQGAIRRFADGIELQGISGTVGDAKLSMDGELTLQPEFSIQSLKYSASGPDFRAFIDLPMLEGLPGLFELSGEVSATDQGQEIRDAVVQLGKTKVELGGTLDTFRDPQSMKLSLNLDSPDSSELKPFLDRYKDLQIPGQPLSVSLNLQLAGKKYDFQDIQASLGASTLGGQASYTAGDVPDIQADIESENLDLSWLKIGEHQDEAEDSGDSGGTSEANKSPSVIFSNEPLPILSWDPITVDLSLGAKTVHLAKTSLSNVQFGFNIAENQLHIDPVSFTSANGGHFAGSVMLKGNSGKMDAEVIGTAEGLKLGLAAGKDQDISTYPPWDYRVDLKASGASMHELATTASGEVEVIVGQGEVAHTVLDSLFSDTMQELITKLNPFAKQSDHTRLECAVGVVHFSQGIANVDPIIYQTDKIVVTSRGDVNLATEKLDLAFNTRARTGIGLSPGMVINPFIKLGGTLAQPSITLDAPRAAVTSGAAVATGGLSLLGESLFDRFLRQRNPCGKVVDELRKMNEK